jgi:hypothetical protein
MTELLEKAIAALRLLPQAQQESMAKWILEELEEDARWQQAFAASLPQLEKLALKALSDHQAGHTQALDPDHME